MYVTTVTRKVTLLCTAEIGRDSFVSIARKEILAQDWDCQRRSNSSSFCTCSDYSTETCPCSIAQPYLQYNSTVINSNESLTNKRFRRDVQVLGENSISFNDSYRTKAFKVFSYG